MRTRHRGHRPAAAIVAAAFLLLPVTPLLPATPARADSIRDQQWALDALHAKRVWRTTRGAGVTVAVLDTGVDDSHPDLAGQVLPGEDLIGFGAERGDRSWARHGTAMAGIIAGHGHGAGGSDGVLGIAPEAKILPVRVILESTDPDREEARGKRGDALARGVRWAADHGADVINLSLGDDSKSAHPDPGEDEAIQYAIAGGAVVVASAGNGGQEGDHISYPAAYPGVIAVTAVDRYGKHAGFSTSRWYTTVSAPGVDVVIADPDRSYYEGWGTSAASAFVSGAVALVRSAAPGLTPAQIKMLLTDTARDPSGTGRPAATGRPARNGHKDATGYGLVDPAAAIEAAGRLPRTTPAAGYTKRYFGDGPTPRREPPEPSGRLAQAAGALGALLLMGALLLWRTGATRRGLRR